MVTGDDEAEEKVSRPLKAVPSSLKQRAWEVMALSLAVILGFNIGDGNIRDKLETGERIVDCLRNVLCCAYYPPCQQASPS